MGTGDKFKLFLMMLLEFAIWGAWLPLIFGYLPGLNFTETQQSIILNAFPAAAILGMFFSNQFADRNFAAEKFMAFSHLIGGAAIFGLAFVQDFWSFLGLMLVHCILYVPTISIANSIAFTHMKDAEREFGIVRMGGTIGWILAAWPFAFLLVDWSKVPALADVGFVAWLKTALGSSLQGDAAMKATTSTFKVAGIASFALAFLSLTLPKTPPKIASPISKGPREGLAWLEAMRLLAKPFIFVLWMVTFIDAAVHQCYFAWTGRFLVHCGIPGNWVMPIMSIGQIAEILTMAILGPVLIRLGWRTTMTIGVLGHAVRFAVFAYLPEYHGLIIGINVLHGVCYAFFFATVYIFVDAYLPKDARASAQGLFNLMILGLGPLAANFLAPYLHDTVFTTTAVAGDSINTLPQKIVDYKGLFTIPMFASVAAACLLIVFFWPPKKTDGENDVES